MEEIAVTEEIVRAQAFEARGDRAGAQAAYAAMWERAARASDDYRACVAAHFMAHSQVGPELQLAWHLRALRAAEAAEAVGDERVRAFSPSLHANLADVYLRLGDLSLAREHVALARASDAVLSDDAYGNTVRGLIARLAQAVEEHPAGR